MTLPSVATGFYYNLELFANVPWEICDTSAKRQTLASVSSGYRFFQYPNFYWGEVLAVQTVTAKGTVCHLEPTFNSRRAFNGAKWSGEFILPVDEEIKKLFLPKRKYELTEEITVYAGLYLRRVKYENGIVGGWIQNESNLSQQGLCRVLGGAMVYGNALVCDNAEVQGNAVVRDSACVGGNAVVWGYPFITGNAKVQGDSWIYDYAVVSDQALIFNAKVYGNAKVGGNAKVYDHSNVYGKADVYGNAEIFGKAKVCGTAAFGGNAKVCSSEALSPLQRGNYHENNLVISN